MRPASLTQRGEVVRPTTTSSPYRSLLPEGVHDLVDDVDDGLCRSSLTAGAAVDDETGRLRRSGSGGKEGVLFSVGGSGFQLLRGRILED